MSHDAIDRCAKSRTTERGPPFARAWHRAVRRGGSSVARFWIVAPASIPYLEEAAVIGHLVPITEPSVPITLKIPGSVARDLRSYSETSGLTLGEIVGRAILRFLKATRRHG